MANYLHSKLRSSLKKLHKDELFDSLNKTSTFKYIKLKLV